jgi:hypothetical protein
MSKNKTTVRITTPAGIAKYCFVNEPQYNFDPDGVYNVTLLLSEADANKPLKSTDGLSLKEALDAQLVLAKEQALETAKPAKKASITANLPYAEEYDESGVTTGNIEFKFKLSAKWKDKEGNIRERKPALFDAARKPIEDLIGSGSKLKIAFNARPYYMPSQNAYGVSNFLSAVQVLQLAEFTSASDFDDEEGYVAPEKAQARPDFEDDEFDA